MYYGLLSHAMSKRQTMKDVSHTLEREDIRGIWYRGRDRVPEEDEE